MKLVKLGAPPSNNATDTFKFVVSSSFAAHLLIFIVFRKRSRMRSACKISAERRPLTKLPAMICVNLAVVLARPTPPSTSVQHKRLRQCAQRQRAVPALHLTLISARHRLDAIVGDHGAHSDVDAALYCKKPSSKPTICSHGKPLFDS